MLEPRASTLPGEDSDAPIRVLFVDDEAGVLDGLRRSLRKQREVWDMVFAQGGAAGLEALRAGEFGVIVCDVAMREVDGFEVLGFAKERQPEALRIVLTGQSDFESAVRSVALAHQVLAKPSDRDEVRHKIERACTLRGLLADAALRRALSSIDSLPSAPTLFTKLTHLLADEDTGAEDIGELLEQDLAMSAKILQVVNSAFFGLPRVITNMSEAAAFLGQRVIRAMVLGEEAFRPFKGQGLFSAADLEREQRHGFEVGQLARRIVGPGELSEGAFLAGMMHDLGWTVIGCLLPDLYRAFGVRRRAGQRGPAIERITMGANHEAIEAFLLGAWGLPLEVVEAVAYHSEPQRVPHEEPGVITAVHVASSLLHELRTADDTPDPRPSGLPLNEDYVAGLGLRSRIDEWRAMATAIHRTIAANAA